MTLKTGKFSLEESDFIVQHYAIKGPTWCARQLGRGYSSTAGHARILGIKYTGPRQPVEPSIKRPKVEAQAKPAKPFPPQPEPAMAPPPRPVWPSIIRCTGRQT